MNGAGYTRPRSSAVTHVDRSTAPTAAQARATMLRLIPPERYLMTTETATVKERMTDWIKKNPLRLWRHREGLSMMDAAKLMRVGMSSVQHWEQGAYYPSDESMVKLATVCGVKVDTLARNWKRWYDTGPTG